jgi:hypothetical protein
LKCFCESGALPTQAGEIFQPRQFPAQQRRRIGPRALPETALASRRIVGAAGAVPLALFACAKSVAFEQLALRTMDHVAAADIRQRDPFFERQSPRKAAVGRTFVFHLADALCVCVTAKSEATKQSGGRWHNCGIASVRSQ